MWDPTATSGVYGDQHHQQRRDDDDDGEVASSTWNAASLRQWNASVNAAAGREPAAAGGDANITLGNVSGIQHGIGGGYDAANTTSATSNFSVAYAAAGIGQQHMQNNHQQQQSVTSPLTPASPFASTTVGFGASSAAGGGTAVAMAGGRLSNSNTPPPQQQQQRQYSQQNIIKGLTPPPQSALRAQSPATAINGNAAAANAGGRAANTSSAAAANNYGSVGGNRGTSAGRSVTFGMANNSINSITNNNNSAIGGLMGAKGALRGSASASANNTSSSRYYQLLAEHEAEQQARGGHHHHHNDQQGEGGDGGGHHNDQQQQFGGRAESFSPMRDGNSSGAYGGVSAATGHYNSGEPADESLAAAAGGGGSSNTSASFGIRPRIDAASRDISRRYGGGLDARERALDWVRSAERHEVECHKSHKARSIYERHAVSLGKNYGLANATAYSETAAFASAGSIGAAQERKNASRSLAHRVDVIGNMPEKLRDQRMRAASGGAGGSGGGRAYSPTISSRSRSGGVSARPNVGDDYKWARGKSFTMMPLRPMRDGRFETPGPGAYFIPSEFQGPMASGRGGR